MKLQRYTLALGVLKRVIDSKYCQEQEIAKLKQRLERLQQTLRQHGYLDDDHSPQSNQARKQAMQAGTIYQLKGMEESLEKRVAAIASQSAPTEAPKSWFTNMMEERGRRFLQ